MGKNIVFKITDYIEPDLAWEAVQCEKLGVEFTAYQMKNTPPSEIVPKVKDADILLVNMALANAELIAGLDRTQIIIRHGIGYDNLDVAAATAHGIVCANEPTASSEDVAEQAIMLMFATWRKINIQFRMFDQLLEQGKLLMDMMYPVYRMGGKTLGIVGCGNIGRFVLAKMRSFGMKILVCDPYLSDERKRELGIEHTPLDTLLRESDIVTIHVPVTPETEGMFNAETIGLMKKTAILVNTSRAKILVVEALADALKNGVIAGAGIDVHPGEPPGADYPLLGLDNALLTPHVAWYSEEGGWDIRHMIMDDLKAFLSGNPPKSVLNPEVFERPNLRMKRPDAAHTF